MSLALGLLTTWLVAWALAVIDPNDGYPTLFGTVAEGWYLLPQHRYRTPQGDVYVDLTRSRWCTEATLCASWYQTPEGFPDWINRTYPLAGEVPDEIMRVFGDPKSFALPGWVIRPSPDGSRRTFRTTAWGWPLPALTELQRERLQYDSAGNFKGATYDYQFSLKGPAGVRYLGRLRLPFRPAWGGFLTDSAVYATLWGLLLSFPAVLRRIIRRRRGLCPRCAYDLTGLPPGSPCPECGRK